MAKKLNRKINMVCPHCQEINIGIEENYATGEASTFCKKCGKYIQVQPWTKHGEEVF